MIYVFMLFWCVVLSGFLTKVYHYLEDSIAWVDQEELYIVFFLLLVATYSFGCWLV